MVKSLYSGVSGLKTHQQKMDVIGNNIANVNTTGYKTNVVTFTDVYYQTKKSPSGATATLGGTNPRQVGYGVKMNTTTSNMTQSGFTYSDSIYDMAIDGEGFFQLMDGSGNTFYTRAGIFNVDEMGYLVDANGYHVLGVSGDSEGQAAGSEIIRITIPETSAHSSSATKEINGTNVTISASLPSDNTDMSVTFTNSTYPYATYSGGILNLFFNMDAQYDSAEAFQQAIADAIGAGGVSLPDDIELTFEFESIPDNAEAVIATNSIGAWEYATTAASGETFTTYTDAAGDVRNTSIGFTTGDLAQNGVTVNIAYDAAATATAVTGSPTIAADGTLTGDWAITLSPNSTMSEINRVISAYIEANSTADATIPSLTCNRFVLPADSDSRELAVAAMAADLPVLSGGTGAIGLEVTATDAGAYANNYKIVFAYAASGTDTKAVWDENTLTISVSNTSTLADINAAVLAASNGDTKKQLTLSGMAGLDDMNAAARNALFGANPSLSLGGGADSFFTEVAKSLTTFALTQGRTGSEQSYKDLDNITVQTDGTIIGYHPVHGYLTLGRVDLATFDNPNGLSAAGGTMFQETVASGVAKLATAGSDGAGEVISGALEMSNVDLAQEFTDMITTQRGYQANSRVITTSDTMLEELLSLKR